MLKDLTFKQTLMLVYRSIKAHIGAGDDAHLPADEEHNGFLTSSGFKKITAASGERTIADYQSDVMALDPGHYEVNKPKNAPVTAVGLCEVEISQSYDGRKQIWLLESGTGRLWYYNTHTNGQVMLAGWTRIFRNVKLWEGDASENNQELHFTMPAGGFEMIKVRYKAYDGTIKTQEFGSGYYRIGVNDTAININMTTTVDSRIQLSPQDNKQDWLIVDVRSYRHNVNGSIDNITNSAENIKLHILAIWGVI